MSKGSKHENISSCYECLVLGGRDRMSKNYFLFLIKSTGGGFLDLVGNLWQWQRWKYFFLSIIHWQKWEGKGATAEHSCGESTHMFIQPQKEGEWKAHFPASLRGTLLNQGCSSCLGPGKTQSTVLPEPVGQYGVTDLRRIRDSCAKPERILSNIHRRAELVEETIGILSASYVKCLHPVTSAAIVGGWLPVWRTCDKITF